MCIRDSNEREQPADDQPNAQQPPQTHARDPTPRPVAKSSTGVDDCGMAAGRGAEGPAAPFQVRGRPKGTSAGNSAKLLEKSVRPALSLSPTPAALGTMGRGRRPRTGDYD